MEHVSQCKRLFESVAVYQTAIVHQIKHALMIFVEIHVLVVLQMLYAVLKIISRCARVNKALMEIQRFNVFELVVDPMMIAHQHIHVLIDNVYQLVQPIHVVQKQNVSVSIM